MFEYPIQDNITFSYHVSLGSSWLRQFLRVVFFFTTLTILRCTCQVFGNMPLSWDLSHVFLMIRVGLWVFRRKTTEVSCHFIPYQGHILPTWRTTIDVDLDRLAEAVFVRFLHCKCKVTLLPPFLYYVLLYAPYCFILSECFFSNEHDYFDNWDRGAIFILEKIDKVSRDICPFFMFCLGLFSTLLHTTPPVVSVGNLSGH